MKISKTISALLLAGILVFPACGEVGEDDDDEGGGGGGSATYGLNLGVITGNTTEGGGTATFTLALKTRPSADVTVSITSGDTTEGTVSPSSVTFTSGTWSTTQTITVTGVDDAAQDGNVTYNVNLSANSSDSLYNGITGVVGVTNEDND